MPGRLSFYSFQYLNVLDVIWASFQILEHWGQQFPDLWEVGLHGKISLWWAKYGCNSCETKDFSGQPSIVYFIRVCKIGSFQVFSLNCSKRSLLIGRFNITKCTWCTRLFSSNSGFEFSMYARPRASKTNIIFPLFFPFHCSIVFNIAFHYFFKSNSYFCKRRKNFWIRGGQLMMYLLKIDFNGLILTKFCQFCDEVMEVLSFMLSICKKLMTKHSDVLSWFAVFRKLL